MEIEKPSRKLIREHWEKVLKVQYSLVIEGIDHDGWYSNKRNGQWLPLEGADMHLYEFKNGNTEVRPKSLNFDILSKEQNKSAKEITADFRSRYDYIRSLQNQFDFDDEEGSLFLWMLEMWDKKQVLPPPSEYKLMRKPDDKPSSRLIDLEAENELFRRLLQKAYDAIDVVGYMGLVEDIEQALKQK